MRRFLLGLVAGVSAGYAVCRAVQSFKALREPAEPLARDPRIYGSLRRNLELAGTLRSLVHAAAFSAGGGAAALSNLSARGPVALHPATFLLAGTLAASVFDLPAAFIEEHEFERRFGLTEQSAHGWAIDHLKASVIGTLVAALLSIPFATLLRKNPDRWPFFATLGLGPVFVLAGLVVPVYIAPLFNKFERVEGTLETRLRALARRFGVGKAAILRMDMSRQTKKANAYVTGMFNTHRIVIGDTLLATFPDEETEFVVAHELGHYVSRDSWRMTAAGIALAGTMFVLSNALMTRPKRAHYEDPAVLYELYVRMLVFSALLRPVVSTFSRSREWAADRFALSATGRGETGASAFRRLSEQNLAEADVPRWYEFLFSTHPSLGARIAALESAG